MTDINNRAIKLAKMNLKENRIANAQVKFSNLYEKIKNKFEFEHHPNLKNITI